MNGEERCICNRQKELYEFAQMKHADIRTFSNDFLKSTFCNNSLDKPYSVDQFADIVNWLEFLEQEGCEIRPDSSQTVAVSREAAGWIGFTYRQLHFVSGLNSRDLADQVPVDRLLLAYPGLHTVDEDMAAEIIIHDFNLKGEQNKKVHKR